MKFGYMVPEFPGQTHTFFWRELRALRDIGMDPEVVSTRKADSRIMSQNWAEEAQRTTTYLAPLTMKAAATAALVLAQAALAGRWTGIIKDSVLDLHRGVGANDLPGAARGVVRRLGLLVVGAELAHLAVVRGWTHLHVHSCADSAQVALFAHQLSGLTYSLTLHGSLGDYGTNQPRKWQHAEFTTVITRQLLEEVRTSLGSAAAERAEVVPMGVDSDTFSRHTPYIPWNNSGAAKVFSCGRLNRSKGHDDLVRAVADLVAKGLDIELVIAGEDEEGGIGYRQYLESLILKLGLTDRIILLGAVSEEQVRTQLESSHIFALASHAEPLGVAIMEAMSMELPVVATCAGGVTELVENGYSGILVRPGLPSVLAREIQKVLSDQELATSLGRAARKKVIGSFTSRRGAVTLSRLIGRLANERSVQSPEVMK